MNVQWEPWHISIKPGYTNDPQTKHQKTLKNIHLLEHKLNMNPSYEQSCLQCIALGQDSLVNKVMSRYDSGIEGVMRK